MKIHRLQLILNNRLLIIQPRLIDYFYTLKVWFVFKYRKYFRPNKKNHLQVLISSHINYIDQTFEPLSKSMMQVGIPPENMDFKNFGIANR